MKSGYDDLNGKLKKALDNNTKYIQNEKSSGKTNH